MTPTLRRSLTLLVAASVVVACLTILGLLRAITFKAFSAEMRRNLRNEAFLEARSKRMSELAQMARLISWDSGLSQAWRRPESSLNTYRKAVQEWRRVGSPSAQREALQKLQRTCSDQLWEQGHRLYCAWEVGDGEGSQVVSSICDLFAVLDGEGVVLVEYRTRQDGRFVVNYPLQQENNQRPVDLSLTGLPAVEAGLANHQFGRELWARGELDPARDLTVNGMVKYPDGCYYQVLVAPNADLDLLVLLGDRIDGRLAAHAKGMCAQADVVITDSARQKVVATTSEPLSRELLQQTLTRQPGTEVCRISGEEFLVLSAVLDQYPRGPLLKPAPAEPVGWMFYLKPTKELELLVRQQVGIVVAIVATVILVAVLAAGRIAAQISSPIESLSLQMARIGHGDLEAQASITGPLEIRTAAQAFNQMVAGLKEKETLEKFVSRLEELRLAADLTDPLVRDQVQFGQHVVVELLGSGGMASVYRALPLPTLDEREAVAVKVMRRELAADENFRRRFQREYQVLRELEHPGVVKVLDYGELNGLVYITMEYLRGQVLSQVLEQYPQGLPLPLLHQVAEQLLGAVDYAHSRNIIHRDLKPDNLMLTENGLKVMDFGLAAATEMSRLTQTREAFGTPAYISPEQVGGGQPGPATDQYTLGVILFELLTGRCPFQGADSMAVIYQHLTQPPPSLCALNRRVPVSVESVVLRMLAKEPRHRLANLAEVLCAWKRAWENPDFRLPDLPVEAPAPGPSLLCSSQADPSQRSAPSVGPIWNSSSPDDTVGFR